MFFFLSAFALNQNIDMILYFNVFRFSSNTPTQPIDRSLKNHWHQDEHAAANLLENSVHLSERSGVQIFAEHWSIPDLRVLVDKHMLYIGVCHPNMWPGWDCIEYVCHKMH